MDSVGDIWQQAADKWSSLTSAMTEADAAKATNCGDWTVGELVDHVMHWQGMGASVFGADASPGDDWAAIKPAMAAALQDPANLEGTAEAMGGMPKQAVAGLVIGDLLIHSWDLARSIGADATLPQGAVEATLMGLQRLPEEMLRSETMFSAPVEVAEDASAQDKLIAFVGRQP